MCFGACSVEPGVCADYFLKKKFTLAYASGKCNSCTFLFCTALASLATILKVFTMLLPLSVTMALTLEIGVALLQPADI